MGGRIVDGDSVDDFDYGSHDDDSHDYDYG